MSGKDHNLVISRPDERPATASELAGLQQENARLKRRLRKSRRQLSAYVDRVTRDFEELWWLRNLAENIEYCEVTNGPETVAAAVLPSLREIIEAQTVVLIPEVDLGRHSPPRRAIAGLPWCWAGPQTVSDGTCRQLIDDGRRLSEGRPVVKNWLADDPTYCGTGLESYVLVPVAKSDCHFGWLLALNKSARAGDVDEAGGAPAALVDPEFGTFEAGLLNAAAVTLAAHMRNVDLFREREGLLIGVMRALVNAIDAKDAYTCGHSDRVARIAVRLAEELGLGDQTCQQIYVTGLLHDVGKIGVPDAILCKPGKLSDEEFEVVKRHPVVGYDILKHLAQLDYVLPGVLHHHESVAGTGYPHRLSGDEIPLPARILAVADAYDAMTSSRPYRQAMPFEKAEQILQDGAGRQWDEQVVAALFRALEDLHEICIDCDMRQHEVHGPSGDELQLPAAAFAESR